MNFDKALQLALRDTSSLSDAPADSFRASVALLLTRSAKLCMIRRPIKKEDPWSGHMAFPGGREDSTDSSLRYTAERECLEEVGIDLTTQNYLGRLTDLSHPSLQVSCFVYLTDEILPTTPCPLEVAKVHWLSFSDFSRTDICTKKQTQFGEFDVINIGEVDVWGISLYFIRELLQKLEKM